MTLLAWHGQPSLKTSTLAKLKEHRAADSMVKGVYQLLDPTKSTGYRGCAIGCTLPLVVTEFDHGDPDWHKLIEQHYGIPKVVAGLIDEIFEALPTVDDRHATFTVDVIDAVPVSADLTRVSHALQLDIIEDPTYGAVQAIRGERGLFASAVHRLLLDVARLHRRALDGEVVRPKEWEALNSRSRGLDECFTVRDSMVALTALDATYDLRFLGYGCLSALYGLNARDDDDPCEDVTAWLAKRLIWCVRNAPVVTSVA